MPRVIRMSSLFLRTLRDDPNDAEVPSHRLLVRAGYIRRAAPGGFSWLPLGWIVYRNVENIVREEMDRSGFQEVHFPALLPREPYEISNRWTEYGDNLKKLGYTFDGWRQLDYWFDLVVELGKRNKKRFAKVVKTRVDSFPDEEVFEWSYDAIKKRYDVATLEKQANAVQLASPEQVREVKDLLGIVRLPEGTVDKWFAKAGVDLWEDMPADVVAKCIENQVRSWQFPAPGSSTTINIPFKFVRQ